MARASRLNGARTSGTYLRIGTESTTRRDRLCQRPLTPRGQLVRTEVAASDGGLGHVLVDSAHLLGEKVNSVRPVKLNAGRTLVIAGSLGELARLLKAIFMMVEPA